MVDTDKYNSYKPATLMAGRVLVELDLYEEHENENKTYLQIKPLRNYFKSSVMEDNIEQAYEMRNNQAHKWLDMSRRQRGEYFANLLSVYVFLCHKYRTVILNKCSLMQQMKIDLPELCRRQVKEHEKEVQEGFRYVPMRWVSADGSEIWGKTTDEIKKKKNVPARIQFSGEAGCGKTTLIKQFIYQDAKQYLNYIDDGSSSGKIPRVPLFIELKKVNEGEDIITYISRTILNCSENETTEKLKDGVFTLYLDGVNEMIKNRRAKRVLTLSVKQLLQKYENVAAIVTDREQVDINLRDMLTVYLPTEPGLAEIINFTEVVTKKKKNSAEITQKVREWLEEKPERCSRFNTPFKIGRLIQIVEGGKALSDNDYDFIQSYVNALLERESVEKLDFMAEPGRLDQVISYVAKWVDCADCKLEKSVYYKCCAEAIKELALQMDAVDCGNLGIQLGLLCVQGDNTISFSDEMLYEYFYLM